MLPDLELPSSALSACTHCNPFKTTHCNPFKTKTSLIPRSKALAVGKLPHSVKLLAMEMQSTK